MAKYSILQNFYSSDAWITFRLITIAERAKKSPEHMIICDHCHKPITDAKQIHLHHMIELTPENVYDVSIALNPDNIMIVHKDCHDAIHQRFGHAPAKGVFIVCGPPLSGKTSYVEERKGRSDIVADMDRIFEAVTFLPCYDKPDILLPNVRGIYSLLIDNIKTRYGRWNAAYVVGGYADKYKRERLAEDLGAEIVLLNPGKDVCLGRLEADAGRAARRTEWKKYIEQWYELYERCG